MIHKLLYSSQVRHKLICELVLAGILFLAWRSSIGLAWLCRDSQQVTFMLWAAVLCAAFYAFGITWIKQTERSQ